jgi:hypothetical protein
MQAQAVFVRIDRHRAQTKLVRRAKYANRDLAPIRRKHFLDLSL